MFNRHKNTEYGNKEAAGDKKYPQMFGRRKADQGTRVRRTPSANCPETQSVHSPNRKGSRSAGIRHLHQRRELEVWRAGAVGAPTVLSSPYRKAPVSCQQAQYRERKRYWAEIKRVKCRSKHWMVRCPLLLHPKTSWPLGINHEDKSCQCIHCWFRNMVINTSRAAKNTESGCPTGVGTPMFTVKPLKYWQTADMYYFEKN